MNLKTDNWENFVDLLQGLENYDSSELRKWMEEHNHKRVEIFTLKDAAYGGSWQKDGLVGAYLNLKRKWDRLSNLFQTGELFDLSPKNLKEMQETVNDTLLDLENYSAMFNWLLDKKREELKKKKTVA